MLQGVVSAIPGAWSRPLGLLFQRGEKRSASVIRPGNNYGPAEPLQPQLKTRIVLNDYKSSSRTCY